MKLAKEEKLRGETLWHLVKLFRARVTWRSRLEMNQDVGSCGDGGGGSKVAMKVEVNDTNRISFSPD